MRDRTFHYFYRNYVIAHNCHKISILNILTIKMDPNVIFSLNKKMCESVFIYLFIRKEDEDIYLNPA